MGDNKRKEKINLEGEDTMGKTCRTTLRGVQRTVSEKERK